MGRFLSVLLILGVLALLVWQAALVPALAEWRGLLGQGRGLGL